MECIEENIETQTEMLGARIDVVGARVDSAAFRHHMDFWHTRAYRNSKRKLLLKFGNWTDGLMLLVLESILRHPDIE